MALASPADRRYVITTVDHGNFKVLGNASDREISAWAVEFVPDGAWEGELTIVGRHLGKAPSDDAVGYGTLAYIRTQLNGAAADYELVPDTVTGLAAILIPASGFQIAIAVECTAGTCTMYSQPLHGTPGPCFRGNAVSLV